MTRRPRISVATARTWPLLLAALLAAALPQVSCTDSRGEPDRDFMDSEELMLKVQGKVLMTYDPATCQLTYNHDRSSFRVCTDDMSQYYQLVCETHPYSQGQNITASLRWCVGSSVMSQDKLSFRVEKVTEEGVFWLWCASRQIGVSVQMVQ